MNVEALLHDGLCRRLHGAFADRGETLYLVGGAVRDALLDRQDLDLDFTTPARPDTTADILGSLGIGHPFRVGERFGTIAVNAAGRLVEITTYRSEVYTDGSRKPEVQFSSTLEEDLQRRDFTINAMALDLATGFLIDPFDGQSDLDLKVLRAVGEPAQRFREDPLRLLRAVRFASRYGFSIAPVTWASMVEQRETLASISRERIRDELEKILTSPRAPAGLVLLRDSGLLASSLPGLLPLTEMSDHGPHHPLSLWDHTMRVVDRVPAEPLVRWAALLHDIAKPATRTHEPNGRPRFFHHEEVGARMAREILSDLRYSNAFVADVSALVEIHMQLHAYSTEWSDGAVRRLVLKLGPLLKPALELVRADAAGHSADGGSHNAPRFDALERRIEEVCKEPPETLHSPLSGEDLMRRYSRPPGRWIGEVKSRLEHEVLEGTLRADDTEGAWALADQLVGQPA